MVVVVTTLLPRLLGRVVDLLSRGEANVELREQIAVVAQEPFLFSETIAENVAFGLPGSRATRGDQAPDMAKVAWAAALADLTDVAGFPRGFETLLSERGVTLSGGQRQRTAIARAVAREPSLLIPDDALSVVDTETEGRILAGLRETMQGRSTARPSPPEPRVGFRSL